MSAMTLVDRRGPQIILHDDDVDGMDGTPSSRGATV
jgi:hypothetical protein